MFKMIPNMNVFFSWVTKKNDHATYFPNAPRKARVLFFYFYVYGKFLKKQRSGGEIK